MLSLAVKLPSDFRTAGTLLYKTKLPLTTWFWAFYLVAHDKRGKLALPLSQIMDTNYRTAQRMLRKIRAAMADRDDQYKLSGIYDIDDAYFGAPRNIIGIVSKLTYTSYNIAYKILKASGQNV